MKYYPKMLVICHNLLEETNNIGKTLLSFMKDWPTDKLYSLYFRREKPFSGRCAGYYCIDDKSVLLSTFMLQKSCGQIVYSCKENEGLSLSNTDSFQYRIGNKRIPIVSYIRDLLWKRGKWKNECLDSWLAEVNPDVIFFVPNDYELAFYVLQYIKTKCVAPVVTFYTDDVFYFNQKNVGIERKRRDNLRFLGKENSLLSKYTFTTCSKMSKEYAEHFKSNYYEIGNSIDIHDNIKIQDNYKNDDEIRISYIGNLHSNRWLNVLDVGNVIVSLNKEGIKYKLHVFSGSDLPKAVMDKLISCDGIVWEGKIENKQVRLEQNKADILLHVEAFDEKSKKSTRLSVSTKIFEYLYAGKIILGYGPVDVASMEFLEDIGCSVLCTEKRDLCLCLRDINNNLQSYKIRATKGTEYAINNFDQNIISQKFYSVINKACTGE